MAIADLPPSLRSNTTSVAEFAGADLDELLASAWGGFDAGTEILVIRDRTATLGGTMLADVRYEGLRPDVRRVPRTRMGRIRQMAPEISLRDWARALDVSPQAVRNWSHREPPDRPELETLIRELDGVSTKRPRLGHWLKEPLSSDGLRPLDLIGRRNWRAFRASARLTPPSARKTVSRDMQARLTARHGALRSVRGPEPAIADDGADDAS